MSAQRKWKSLLEMPEVEQKTKQNKKQSMKNYFAYQYFY